MLLFNSSLGCYPRVYDTLGLQYLSLELQYLSLEFVFCVCLTPHWDATLGSYATLGLIYSSRPCHPAVTISYIRLEFVVCFCLTPHWDVTLGSYATLGLQYITLELQMLP